MLPDTVTQQIIDLENARCSALVDADLARLDALFDDDLVYIHSTGQSDDKSPYLALVGNDITVLRAARHHSGGEGRGDGAVATGRLRQTIEFRATAERSEMNVITTQVWRRRGDGWRLSFQATNR